MGDYPWNDDETVQAASAAMLAEAKRWHGFSDTARSVHARFARLGLDSRNFSVVDPAAAPAANDLAAAYTAMHERLTSLFQQASEEFDHMARALRVSADKYDESDRSAAGLMSGVW
jgi:uncharacterized protein YukE